MNGCRRVAIVVSLVSACSPNAPSASPPAPTIAASVVPVGASLPKREGASPRTTMAMPHSIRTRPRRCTRSSRAGCSRCQASWKGRGASVPGARALLVAPCSGAARCVPRRRRVAYLLARKALAAGWAEPHARARSGQLPENVLMIYAPRNDAEIDTVVRLVDASRARALGEAK